MATVLMILAWINLRNFAPFKQYKGKSGQCVLLFKAPVIFTIFTIRHQKKITPPNFFAGSILLPAVNVVDDPAWTSICLSTSDHTIQYDTRCYINVRSKANMSQLNLPQMPSSGVTRVLSVWGQKQWSSFAPRIFLGVHGTQSKMVCNAVATA